MNDEGQLFEDLVRQALELGEDEHGYWGAVDVLQSRANRETLEKTFELSRGDAPNRQLAAAILGRFSEVAPTFKSNPAFRGEIVARLLEMLSDETDGKVVGSLSAALSHQEEEPRVFEALRVLARHPAVMVRWHVALGLSKYQAPEAIELVMQLMEDEDEVVRDWATFGLGARDDLDSPALRAAFVARLNDSDAHTRAEALYALAERKDPRVAKAILEEFESGRNKPLLFEDIEHDPGYRLLPALCAMAQDADYAGDREELQAAIAACGGCETQNEN